MLNKNKTFSLVLIAINVFVACVFCSMAAGAESPIVISQIQTNGPGSGTTEHEFIEIYNKSNNSVDLVGWQLRYVASTGNLLTAKNFINISTELKIHPDGFVVFAPESYHPEITEFIRYKTTSFSGLSIEGATVDLIDPTGNVIDRVGYGSKPEILCENRTAPAPEKAGSIIRKVDDGKVVDTDDNFSDFELLPLANFRIVNNSPPNNSTGDQEINNPTGNENISNEQPNTGDSNTSPNTQDQGNPSENSGAAPEASNLLPLDLKITEIMIDPEFPLVDSNDEWIEIYNPNEYDVNLEDYRIETGSTGSYKYIFENSKIGPKSYLVVKSMNTPISLSNTAGKVSLYDASNKLSDSVSYSSVEAGMSYAKDSSGNWQWTTTVTENSENIITVRQITPAGLAKTTANKASPKPKTNTTAKTKATVKAAPAPKVAKSKAAKVTQVKSDQASKPLIAVSNPIPNSVVAILLVVAIIYSVYEYRYELRNKITQLRIFAKNR